MKRTDAQIHQREMLLTLDYLLNHTDKDHPATQQDICRHAKDFGLNYNPKSTKGNDIRRQRVAECLQYLLYLCTRYKDSDQIPFVVNTTDNGKFYMEEKNHLNDEQIIKILSAIKNDKYTEDEDTQFLTERILDAFSNCYNRENIKEEAEKATKVNKRNNASFNRKMKAVTEAYNEGKCVKIRFKSLDKEASDKIRRNVYIDVEYAYRVYKIQEYNNKPYALLLRIQPKTAFDVNHPIIFDAVENLNIPVKKPLEEDMDTNRDLDKLYKQNAIGSSHYYGNLENMMKANIRPEGGYAFIVSFYFHLNSFGDSNDEELIAQSFQEFFSKPLEYTRCAHFKTLKERNYGRCIPLPKKTDKGILVPEKLKKGETLKYGVCNISVNKVAFLSWVFSGNYRNSILHKIHIAGPAFIKEDIASYYYGGMHCYAQYLSDDNKEELIHTLQRELEKSRKAKAKEAKRREEEETGQSNSN